MVVVSASLPQAVVEEMDAAIGREGAAGRSAFIRAAVRARSRTPGLHGHMHGSITISYAHGEEARVSEVRHAFHDVVLSLMHSHCAPEQCMDVLLVGGDGQRITDLHRTLERMRHIDHAVLVPITTPAADAGDDAP